MDDDRLVAYCGLYCGDCFFYRGEIARLAKELRAELRRARLTKHYPEFADFPICYRVLGAMLKMKCRGGSAESRR